jgi:hypothetical protein
MERSSDFSSATHSFFSSSSSFSTAAASSSFSFAFFSTSYRRRRQRQQQRPQQHLILASSSRSVRMAEANFGAAGQHHVLLIQPIQTHPSSSGVHIICPIDRQFKSIIRKVPAESSIVVCERITTRKPRSVCVIQNPKVQRNYNSK